MATMFGQVVFGPPGSGKTTYCQHMAEFLRKSGRKVAIINLDPANEGALDTSQVDISNLVTVEDVMDTFKLGPNGALVYCLEYLEKNFEWLLTEIKKFQDHYLMFDLPGQVELYTHHSCVRNIIKQLENFGVRLSAVNLVDSHYCSDAGKFVSVLLTSLTTMLQMELPQVNVLSKIDLAEKYGKLQFNLEYYTEVLELEYLLQSLDSDFFTKKYQKLNAALISVIEDYSLVSFVALNVKEPKTLQRVQSAVDKANGYVFGTGEQRNIQNLLSCAIGASSGES